MPFKLLLSKWRFRLVSLLQLIYWYPALSSVVKTVWQYTSFALNMTVDIAIMWQIIGGHTDFSNSVRQHRLLCYCRSKWTDVIGTATCCLLQMALPQHSALITIKLSLFSGRYTASHMRNFTTFLRWNAIQKLTKWNTPGSLLDGGISNWWRNNGSPGMWIGQINNQNKIIKPHATHIIN